MYDNNSTKQEENKAMQEQSCTEIRLTFIWTRLLQINTPTVILSATANRITQTM